MSDVIQISRGELEEIVKAAVASALGLPDDDKDRREFVSALHEAKGLVEAWRSAKTTVWQTIVKWLTALVLSAIALGVGYGVHDKFK